MESYKNRTLKAWKRLAWKYRHPEDQIFFTPSSCPTCMIYFTSRNSSADKCIGCPMSRDPEKSNSNMGCRDFKSYEYASMESSIESYIARAKFFEKTLPMLEKVPAKFFTPTRWTFEAFKFLKRSW